MRVHDKPAMIDKPAPPREALSSEELQRFLRGCSRERRSPTTRRIIDASSYGWIHRFILAQTDGPPVSTEAWLNPGDAYPDKLGGFFSRVATRIGDNPASQYAGTLAAYFEALSESLQQWPDTH